KLPIQIKPGAPPVGPGMPKPPTTPGTGKTPGTGTPSPTQPGNPPTTPGVPSTTPGGPGAPAAKKDDVKWPKEINGKTVEVIVKEMRTASDPAVREAAVRTLPLFGPKGREHGADDLVLVMTRDSDWNVRLAGLSIAPTVPFAYATGAYTPLANGVSAIMTVLVS